ncbi:MAG: hypothetical protein JWQ34_3102 [Mucilaginibacter sp.]|uniref:sensor histidine kinase n=1 Tax=Mucilaginibacter sp. TaxID=1882438 RepID=UPI00261AA09C|nr:7TM diverse intracellular signaling domain-containing protein [Mucilaginibacter sp.]MDB5004877.1 hypothetical protein [Mucilaginibacter sp.]
MKKILLILCLLIRNISVFAGQTDTLKIHTNETRYLTNQYFLELEDPDNTLSIKNILTNHHFHTITSTFPRLKYSKSITWLKFAVTNKTNQTFLPITISKSIIDDFDVYFLEPMYHKGHKTFLLKHLSAHDPQFNSNLLNQSVMLVNAPVSSDSTVTFFARIKSNASTVIPIEINSAAQFVQKRSFENLVNGAIIGVFIIMALYNLMLFIIVGDRSYLYYVIYITFLGANQSLLLGFGNSLFPNDLPLLNKYIIPILRVFFGYSLLLFAGEFLHFKQNIKRYYNFYLFLFVLYTFPLLATITGYTHNAYTLSTVATLTTSSSLLVIVSVLYYRGFKPAKFFIIGWGLFLVSIMVSIARNNGFVPFNYFTLNIVIYSALIELILFSIALADKINYYRRENTESQLAALTIARENERLITEQNIFLENKVKERTQELIQTNQNLSVTIDNLKSAQIQLIETEKMASLGQLTAGVAHEINNPINFVSANVKPLRIDFDEIFELLGKYELAANNGTPELLDDANNYKNKINVDFVKNEINTLLDGIEDGASRTAEIVQSLRTFSRMDESVLIPANINTAILSTLVILRSSIPYYIEIKPILEKLQPLNCYAGKINQALINLINNSIQAITVKEMHNNESIAIYTYDHTDHITIKITDTGIGMTNNVKQRIFEPFFTTKNIGEGTGLGLSIVFGIIEKHKGTINVESVPGAGTTFTVTLPKDLVDEDDDHS